MRVGVPYDWVVIEKLVGVDQHIVKIHGIVLSQALLIEHVESLNLLIAEILYSVILRTDQVVF